MSRKLAELCFCKCWNLLATLLMGLGRAKFIVLVVSLFAVLLGCAYNPDFTSVEEHLGRRAKKGFHEVKKGETLYSIAWRYGWDYRDLAAANNIPKSYVIVPGQMLKVDDSGRYLAVRDKKSSLKSSPASANTASPKATSKNSTSAANPAPKTTGGAVPKKTYSPPKVTQSTPQTLVWHWPLQGKIIRPFSTRGKINKGIDIAAQENSSVRAAASGEVVYAGNGLKAYGNLIIIKHNDNYLSAYAHNKKILVGEGKKVKALQKIAEIGFSSTDSPMLHFEIRRDGKPVNPLRYLPK